MIGLLELAIIFFIIGFFIGLIKTKSIILGILTGVAAIILAPIILFFLAILTILLLIGLAVLAIIIIIILAKMIL